MCIENVVQVDLLENIVFVDSVIFFHVNCFYIIVIVHMYPEMSYLWINRTCGLIKVHTFRRLSLLCIECR